MLSTQEVDKLYQFCEKKGVRYYDIQAELVDHLANGIEELQAQDPTLSFERALEMEYKKFGLFGFSKILGEKMVAAHKKQRNTFYRILKESFGWPKVILFFLLTTLFYKLAGIEQVDMIGIIFLFSSVSYLIISTTCSIVRMKKRKKSKKILLDKYRYQSELITIPIYLLCFGTGAFGSESSFLRVANPIFAAIILAFYIVAVIAHLQMTQLIDKEIEKTLAELNYGKN